VKRTVHCETLLSQSKVLASHATVARQSGDALLRWSAQANLAAFVELTWTPHVELQAHSGRIIGNFSITDSVRVRRDLGTIAEVTWRIKFCG